MQLIRKYFPELDPVQSAQYKGLLELIPEINSRVNIISRKDIGSLEERHILHSLAIAKRFPFSPGTMILDAGTGGGFPGIPLAIMFPGSSFILVDSIQKKIRMVEEVTAQLGLKNVSAVCERVERTDGQVDFVVSRAVTAFTRLQGWTSQLIRAGGDPAMPNGLISLKGGALSDELQRFEDRVEIYPVSNWFEEPFFYQKMIVYLKK